MNHTWKYTHKLTDTIDINKICSEEANFNGK